MPPSASRDLPTDFINGNGVSMNVAVVVIYGLQEPLDPVNY